MGKKLFFHYLLGIDSIELSLCLLCFLFMQNPVEIQGLKNAHIRDGAAVVQYLAWLDKQVQELLREIWMFRLFPLLLDFVNFILTLSLTFTELCLSLVPELGMVQEYFVWLQFLDRMFPEVLSLVMSESSFH